MTIRYRLTTGLMVVLLAGCATSPPPPEPVEMPEVMHLAATHQRRVAEIGKWTVKGRIGLIRGEEGWHAGLSWSQRGAAYEIDLDGPVGQAALRLIGDDQLITLFLPDEAPMSADTPERLVRDNLGWELPVSGMRWWIKGQTQPDASSVNTLDELGRLQEIKQADWKVLFLDYQSVDGVDLPRKIRLEHPELTIKLVLHQWSLGE
ncbi:MAG: outer membrane lipoprotein LolB [Gammaproteobacteria bacterium]|nr:outer membrane lipoprotein LolB [Gammaproteobacteria bacterium]MCP5136275.1 outer membrane lipoprotein LolB [Gammaproteobacteria bacterium]